MKKTILAIAAVVILLSAGSVLAEDHRPNGRGGALKLIDANDRDLGYLIGANQFIGNRSYSTYTTYNPTIGIFLIWAGSDGQPLNLNFANIYYSQPNCTGKAYDILHFEIPGQNPECNNILLTQNSGASFKMQTCQLTSATITSVFSTNGCENIATTSVNDAYLLKPLDPQLLSAATPPFRVIEE